VGDERWEEFENAVPSLSGMFPEIIGQNKTKVKPMGWLERLIGGNNNIATTDLDGTINYNAEAGRASGLPPEQILAHELQHVRQNNSRGLMQNIVERFKQGVKPWESRPDEIDAMRMENPVRGFRRTGDIDLPASVNALQKR
jgi:hypothetical protein